jgi:hypothetical protein
MNADAILSSLKIQNMACFPDANQGISAVSQVEKRKENCTRDTTHQDNTSSR